MKKVKFGWKQYWKPTPKRIRGAGDTVMSAAGIVSGIAIFADYKWLSVVLVVAGIGLKFLSNFFTNK
jgi:hypothetical protein